MIAIVFIDFPPHVVSGDMLLSLEFIKSSLGSPKGQTRGSPKGQTRRLPNGK